MRMFLFADEYYPFRWLLPPRHPDDVEYIVEVSEEFLARYNRIMTELAQLQDELENLDEVVI